MPDDTDSARLGRWDPVFPLPGVAIHTHLLPDGTVLFWGRRADPTGSMHQPNTAVWIWDPHDGSTRPTPPPTRDDADPVNLFCAGHSFLPDGRLLVAGGHVVDGDGLDQACAYDYRTGEWEPLPVLRSARWYPTVTTLADGRALVVSGSHRDGAATVVEAVSEIGDGEAWHDTADFRGLPLYPRLHVVPDGRVFMSGTNATTHLLDPAAATWTPLGSRSAGERQYGPAVQYAPGQVLYVGGGDDVGGVGPTATCEKIDLTAADPGWVPAASMGFRRRQHNATLLPDGTVLVTGGTRGPGFNDLEPGPPVHEAELWDPATDRWTVLAAEAVDRCYHSTALLLPDATVLSAGGGELMVGDQPNAPADTHRDAQVFRPPYLFRGPRPTLVSAPESVELGATFAVVADGPVARATLLRLGSVTHAFDMNQRFVELDPAPTESAPTESAPSGSASTGAGTTDPGTTATADAATVRVTVPSRPGECPPGHYLLFVLNDAGVPSVAAVLQVVAPAPAPAAPGGPATDVVAPEVIPAAVDVSAATGTPVTVGLTSLCPYGLGPCWGGAYEALSTLDGVAYVVPDADQTDQTARVYLDHDGLPDVDLWRAQFAASANASYEVRGVEVTLTGTVTARDGGLDLTAAGLSQPLPLRALRPGTQLAWDIRRRRRRPLMSEERSACARLAAEASRMATVTGPLQRSRNGWTLAVRVYTTART